MTGLAKGAVVADTRCEEPEMTRLAKIEAEVPDRLVAGVRAAVASGR